jgi:cell division protein FtsB
MAQLAAIRVKHGNQDSTTKSFAALKNVVPENKVAWEKSQADTETLTMAVEELKKTIDKLAARVPSLEDEVKHLDNKVLDSLTEL